MCEKRTQRPPLLLPGMGSPLETEIRRVEFTLERNVRFSKAGAKYE